MEQEGFPFRFHVATKIENDSFKSETRVEEEPRDTDLPLRREAALTFLEYWGRTPRDIVY